MRKQILGLFLLLLAGVLYAGEVEVPRLSPLPERVMEERVPLSGKRERLPGISGPLRFLPRGKGNGSSCAVMPFTVMPGSISTDRRRARIWVVLRLSNWM